MISRDDLPATPDWVPDCRCGENPCVKAPEAHTCIALMGDEWIDQA